MPSVFVVPVYVEVPSGIDRAVPTLESYLRRAGYIFHTGEPLAENLDATKLRLEAGDGRVGSGHSPQVGRNERLPELRE